ncbi:EamA family transporter [Streptomyces sp. NPDC001292]|uniref:EamA family transporter n=1 Tax=Streptomyces sp. NPDC001292 TaxID=3364558 RepID=UPI003677B1E1
MLDARKTERLRTEYRNRQVRWGFIWALWCAVLWGAWYVPGSAIYTEAPFVDLVDSTGKLLLASMVVAFLNALAVLAAMFLWVGVLGKGREYVRTLRQTRISRWYLPAGLAGGLAVFGSYVAIVYVGAQFAAVAGLLYPIIGALVARVWYHERITPRAAVGIVVIVAGGVVIFTPGLIGELTGTGTGGWIGYLAGAATFIGWGLEGAIAGRALDVSDPDVGLTLRFTFEVGLWLLVAVPVTVLLAGDAFLTALGRALTSPAVWLMLVLMGVTFAFCYVSWYKSFPLIGVGRGQAIAALYGPLALLWLFAFTHKWPGTEFVIGAAIAVAGSFILFTERRGILEIVRAVPARQVRADAVVTERSDHA